MTLLSTQCGVLFIHIQKTGGVSISSLLRRKGPGFARFLDLHGWAWDARLNLPAATYDSLYKFAFVRNPWDRLVSWYSMLDQKRGLSNPMKRSAWKHGSDFASFVRHTPEVVDFKEGARSFGFNQIDYIADNGGKLIVNDVYRFEDFTAECKRLCERLGWRFRPRHVPHKNTTSHRHYSTYYTPELREIVAQRFARDIAAFNYTFESQP